MIKSLCDKRGTVRVNDTTENKMKKRYEDGACCFQEKLYRLKTERMNF